MPKPRAKGKSFEYEIRDSIRHLDPNASRSIMSGAIGHVQGREQGDILNAAGLCIECKRTERCHPYDFYTQVKEAATNDQVPVVAFRSNRREPLAILSWTDFIFLYEYALKAGLKKSFQGR